MLTAIKLILIVFYPCLKGVGRHCCGQHCPWVVLWQWQWWPFVIPGVIFHMPSLSINNSTVIHQLMLHHHSVLHSYNITYEHFLKKMNTVFSWSFIQQYSFIGTSLVSHLCLYPINFCTQIKGIDWAFIFLKFLFIKFYSFLFENPIMWYFFEISHLKNKKNAYISLAV